MTSKNDLHMLPAATLGLASGKLIHINMLFRAKRISLLLLLPLKNLNSLPNSIN